MEMLQYASLDVFISKQKELLKLEQQEEVSERQRMYENQSLKELEKKGICLRRLTLDHQKTGLFGRSVVVFSFAGALKNDTTEHKNERLRSHRLTPGDIVGLYPNKGGPNEVLETGIVSFSRSQTIGVAFNEEIDGLNLTSRYRLMKLTNDVTYRRLNKALELLNKISPSEPSYRLQDILFPCKRIEEKTLNHSRTIKEFFNKNLDESQQQGVRFAIQTSLPICVIHGPPGTGKTTTVVEIIRQEVKDFSKKVLVCAPSNIAVDNLVERLAQAELKVVRLGHPARLMAEVQKHCLDAILDAQDSSGIIKSVKEDIAACFSNKSHGTKDKVRTNARDRRLEVKELKKELMTRQSNAIKEILSKADVILSTTNSATKKEGPLKYLPTDHFDLLVIDEAAQAMEMSCWIPLLQVSRCILAGDHLQLPPTIISEKAARSGLATTLLERIVHGLGENSVHMLTTQYRMNQLIMQWPSEKLYGNKLHAAECVAKHKLCDIDSIEKTVNTNVPLIFTDTAGCNMNELEGHDNESKGNTHEVEIIKKHIEDLVTDGVPMINIGVITPYNLQVELIRQAVLPDYPKVEINSVDGFQGREKEAILISLVRSNEDGEVGFLKEDRRINVAITRARRHLFIVGDSTTISNHPFLESMCSFLFEHAELRSPRYEDDGNSNTAENDIAESLGTLKFDQPLDKNFKDSQCKISDDKNIVKKKPSEKNDMKKHENISRKQQFKNKSTIQQSEQSNKVDNVLHTEEALEKQIYDFVQSNTSATFEFPFALSSRERAFVHEKAESSNLNHISQGEGSNRRIVITKKESPVQKDRVVEIKDTTKDVLDENNVNCPTCLTSIPKMNFELHSLRCVPKRDTTDTKKSTSTKKKKKATPKQNIKAELQKEENIDEVLEEFSKINSRCRFERCKTSIKTLGQRCEFCSQMFCLSHHVAESHGCGSAAKIKARQDIAKYHDKKPRPMNNIKKAQVHNKLNKKLTELEEERRKKSNSNKK